MSNGPAVRPGPRLTFPAPGLYWLSMMRKRSFVFGSILMAVGLLGPHAPGQIAAPAADFPMRTFFSVRSAQPDSTIPDVLREQFEKDDGSPLRSVSIDLNADGRDEKLVLCGVPSAVGGYQWLVFDPFTGVGRGVVIGTLFFVGREADSGYARLETYWRQGGKMSIVSLYTFARGRYVRSETRALSLWEASEYFRSKGPLDLDQELAEIK